MSTDRKDIWSRLAEPVPQDAIEWRQDGKVSTRNGKFYARFVAYVSANVVRERLDSVVPGEWDLSIELLPPNVNRATGEDANDVSFKARLQILGVVREDVGTGKDYKSAATDAFKRAGVRFGIAHELYAYDQNWVQVESDSKFAKPLIDPGLAYAQRHSGNGSGLSSSSSSTSPVERAPAPARQQETRAEAAPNGGGPSCPKCGSGMYDNRLSKRNPRAPDY